MAVYDINGTNLSLSVLKDVNGGLLNQAYDVGGNPLFSPTPPAPSEYNLVVMTYNVQRFRGINAQQEMQDLIVNTYEPDIIGIQELTPWTAIPEVGENMLADYPIRQQSAHQNYTLMATKSLQLSNIVIADYVNQDPEDMSQWNETRGYMKADITVNGKTVTWFNTHLCYMTKSVTYQQMTELFNLAQQCEYVILTGDFNSSEVNASSDDYIGMYKQFVDAGYNLANNSPSAGFQNTFTNATTATSLSDLTDAPDTIITSSNIGIHSVVFDTTKFSYLNGGTIDHIPVIARLFIS